MQRFLRCDANGKYPTLLQDLFAHCISSEDNRKMCLTEVAWYLYEKHRQVHIVRLAS